MTDHQANPSGFSANELVMLVQKTTTGQRPEADEWTEIDMTSQISGIYCQVLIFQNLI